MARATIRPLRSSSGSLVKDWIPLTKIMANIMTAAPPNTDCGITENKALSFGQNPHRIRNTAPVIITKRLTTFVTATRPTFCEKEVFGSTPKIAPRIEPRPSAITPPCSSLSVASRFNPPFATPETSPIVSTVVAMNMIPIAIIACELNSKATGIKAGSANQLAEDTCVKSTIPSIIARI